MGERRELRVELSDEAQEGWRQYAAEQGVTLTALMEALGVTLARGPLRVEMATVVRRARVLDAERRRRS